MHDPQVWANRYVIQFAHPVLGDMKMLNYPVDFSETPIEVRAPAPAFGQHTEEVLLDVGGYTWDELVKLKENKVII